jgi:hypothetical protein
MPHSLLTILPYRGCLNVHEKNMENIFQTKKSITAKMIVRCKQRYTRTSLLCCVAVVDLRYVTCDNIHIRLEVVFMTI